MAAAVIVTAEVGGAKLTCQACGTAGVILRETGDVMDRIRVFACSHLEPTVVAVRLVANGLDFGWCDA